MVGCALYEIAQNPGRYLQPLREEVQAVVDKEGWTKAAVSKMYKMDSFFKEVQRCHDIGLRTLYSLFFIL